jgi:flagellar hook-length control protein FliK
MLNAFGIGLPNALPQAGGTADAVLSDGQSVARRGAAVEQVAVRLQVAVKQGQNRINIRLHPAELGRVEVKLDLAEDGPLRAVLIAERSDTLELLQRDAGQLERTLAQAGLKLDSGSLNFSLQGQAHDGDGTGEKGSTGAGSGHSDAGDEDLSVPDGRWSIHDGVLDLVI